MSAIPDRPRRRWHDLDGKITPLAPLASAGSLSGFLDATHDGAGEPFSPDRIAAIESLSVAFLAHPALRHDAAIAAVAYWMRRAQLQRLHEEWDRRLGAETGVVRVPAGRVLTLAPANVDTLFLYSWALSFLCGNANVVRLSHERPPLVDVMLDLISTNAEQHEVLRRGDRFVTYAHDDAITAALSSWCSHRVIWGGNETIATIRPIALNPHASERVFGSKFSYSAIDAERFRAADAATHARLASGLFNDVFWFDQMACSSPHVLFWVGAPEVVEASWNQLERELQAEADRRGFIPGASAAVLRRTFAFELALDAHVEVRLEHPAFIGVRVRAPDGLTRAFCGGGMLRHYRLERLEDLTALVSEGDQTMTHFGFDADHLRTVARSIGARGVDRVVPIGEALAFDATWDGFDLLDDFTRRVRVR